MPRPAPVPDEVKRLVVATILAGVGRNEIARRLGISAGSVTNIARQHALYFERASQTATGSAIQKHRQEIERLQRIADTEAEYFNHEARYTRYGEETRGSARERRRIEYRLYDLDRHHDRRPRVTAPMHGYRPAEVHTIPG